MSVDGHIVEAVGVCPLGFQDSNQSLGLSENTIGNVVGAALVPAQEVRRPTKRQSLI